MRSTSSTLLTICFFDFFVHFSVYLSLGFFFLSCYSHLLASGSMSWSLGVPSISTLFLVSFHFLKIGVIRRTGAVVQMATHLSMRSTCLASF
ncbi:hypothetical protein PSV08DRAFT_320398 [Bipolaris maydis]|uniref:uncharacterized protein n=1 Tax=Cochliobolus heterostrophus TaxID=5016 RepID=UPI0024D8600C|nr:hypothetical protein J3E74DRAFT_363149 [Bipolaris maydis]KAJ6268613.1 hypothetical protein PSV08DRAFT_320398 [Bipolaris maydis]